MPDFVVRYILPYVVPIIIQGLTPVIAEYTKIAVTWLGGHLPKSAMVVLASAVAEGVNQAQSAISGTPLPPGVAAIISIFINELGADFKQQPPTPGVAPHNAV